MRAVQVEEPGRREAGPTGPACSCIPRHLSDVTAPSLPPTVGTRRAPATRQLPRSLRSDDVLAGDLQGLGSLARQGVLPQTAQYRRTTDALRPRFADG